MEEFVEKDSFEFGDNLNNEESSFEYNNISGLGESIYENEDIFNSSIGDNVQPTQQFTDVPEFNIETPVEINDFNPSFEVVTEKQSNEVVEEPVIEPINNEINEEVVKEPVYEPINVFEIPVQNEINDFEEQSTVENVNDEVIEQPINAFEPVNSFEESSEPIKVFDESDFNNSNFTFGTSEEIENVDSQINQSFEVDGIQNVITTEKIDNEFLETEPETFSNSMVDNFEYDVVAPTVEPITEEKEIESTNIISDTPIEELNKLTEYKEEKISATDIKSLFNRVGSNVQEASDIFMKNTEMKEKIDAKFEELKQLQAEVENSKKTQYDEINAYKEEVFGKLTEKKQEVEDRINKLKEFQENLEREKEEFEKYKKEQTDEIERVQKEVQDAYESRREELNHIEDVLRKQKDSLDEERNQLSLDKIQYEADKNELANNLLKFNQIVDSFTIGMESAGKGE